MFCLMVLSLHVVFSHFVLVSKLGKRHNSLHYFCTALSTRSPADKKYGSPPSNQQEKF